MTEQERTRIQREANMRIASVTAPTAKALVDLITYADNFIDKVIATLPVRKATKKQRYELVSSGRGCCGHSHNSEVSMKSFSGREISDIERLFRAIVGSAVVNQLLDDEKAWEGLAAGIDLQGTGSPLYQSRLEVATGASLWANETAENLYKIEAQTMGSQWVMQNPFISQPLNLSVETPWIKKMNEQGFRLVSDKIKLDYVPRIKQIIVQGVQEQIPYDLIADRLRDEMQFGKRWDWIRLVRTEMAQAMDKSTMEQYEANGVPYVRWSASRAGNTCEICLDYNGNIYALEDAPDLPHPQCRCVKLPTFRKNRLQGNRVDPVPIR